MMAQPPRLPPHAAQAMADRYCPGPSLADDPARWARERQPGIHLWSGQIEIMESVRDHSRTAVKSCHSAGKSFTASQVVCWWVDSHPRGDAFVVTSAPTGDQVKAILWREIGRSHSRGGLPGRTNLTEWYVGEEMVALGRKPNDYEPTAFQGVHELYVLVVLDEACGIPKTLWDAADTLASNRFGRVLAIGNPDDPQSHFATVCSLPTWNTITIRADDTPNFTGEEVPQRVSDVLLAKEWVEDKAVEWGIESPLYQAKVLAQFPQDSEDGVVPSSWLARARRTELVADEDDELELGLDVAAGGADRTVCWARKGPVALGKWHWREGEPATLASNVLEVIRETGAMFLKVDSIGVGWGIGGVLQAWREEGKHDCQIVPVNVSEASGEDPEHLLNLRAELWWRVREACRDSAWDLRALDDDDAADLTAPKFHTRNPKRRIQVESKDEIKKRLRRSTDSADALLLAFHPAQIDAVILDFGDLRVPVR